MCLSAGAYGHARRDEYSKLRGILGMPLVLTAAASPGYGGGSEARRAASRVSIDIVLYAALVLSKALLIGCCCAAKAAVWATSGGG